MACYVLEDNADVTLCGELVDTVLADAGNRPQDPDEFQGVITTIGSVTCKPCRALIDEITRQVRARDRGVFYQRYKDSSVEKEIKLHRVEDVLSADYQNVEMALDLLITNGEINTTFSIIRFETRQLGE